MFSTSCSCSHNFVTLDGKYQFGLVPTLSWLFTLFSKNRNCVTAAIMLYMDGSLDEADVLMIFDELEVRI